MPSFSDSRATTAAGAAATSSGTNPSPGSVHSCTATPSTLCWPRNFRTNASSAGPSVKYRISSARAGSGQPRRCASSSAENTSLVATGVPIPEERTSLENTYPTGTLTRSKTRQPGLSLCGRDPNRCFCAGWCEPLQAGDTLVFWKSDRWGCSAAHVLTTIGELRDHGVTVKSLTENFDLDTKEGRFMFAVLAAATEYELELRAERQAEGIAAARRRQAE